MIHALVSLIFGVASLVSFFVGIIGIGSAFFPAEDLEIKSRGWIAVVAIGFLILSGIFGWVAL